MSQHRRLAVLFVICHIMCTSFGDNGHGRDKRLSRKKRYVVFPEGSSFSIALCMTVHTLTSDNIFTEGLNWGISYDLPNESKPALEPFLELRKDPPRPGDRNSEYEKIKYPKRPTNWNNDKYYDYSQIRPFNGGKKYRKPDYNYMRRRHRRELYNKLEVIMNAMGFEGRTCVLRALCEASQRLMPKGNTLVEEMMRIAFTLPLKRVFAYEPDEHRTYTDAHRAGHEGRNCGAMFPRCGFSLIDMALGRYSDDDGDDERPNDEPDRPSDVPDDRTNERTTNERPVSQSSSPTSDVTTIVRYNMK